MKKSRKDEKWRREDEAEKGEQKDATKNKKIKDKGKKKVMNTRRYEWK
jgi:hypothetical protein